MKTEGLKAGQIASNKPSPPTITSVIERQTSANQASVSPRNRPRPQPATTSVVADSSRVINGTAEPAPVSVSGSEKSEKNATTKTDYDGHSDETPADTSDFTSEYRPPNSLTGGSSGGGASLMTFLNAIPRRVNLVAAAGAGAGTGAASLFTSWLTKRSSSVDISESHSSTRSPFVNRPIIVEGSESPRTSDSVERPVGVSRRHIFTLQTRKGLTMNGCSAAASVDESTEAADDLQNGPQIVSNRLGPRGRRPKLGECKFFTGKISPLLSFKFLMKHMILFDF